MLSRLSYLCVESNIVRLIIFVQIDTKKQKKQNQNTNKQTNKQIDNTYKISLIANLLNQEDLYVAHAM